MADITYNPTAWADDKAGGTNITAKRLNNMETGIANAVAAINVLNTNIPENISNNVLYALRMHSNVYEGRQISEIPEIKDAVVAAGSVPEFLHKCAAAMQNYLDDNATDSDLVYVLYDAYLNIYDYEDIAVGSQTMRYRIYAKGHDYGAGDTAQPYTYFFVPDETYEVPSSDTSYVVNGSYIKFNTSNTNNGTSTENNPYLASQLHKYLTNVVLPRFPQIWRNRMVTRRKLAPERYSSSALTESTGWVWKDFGKLFSLTEMEVYGCQVWSGKYETGYDTQLPGFKETKNRIKGRIGWWLASSASGSSAWVCAVGDYGRTACLGAASDWLRPLP